MNDEDRRKRRRKRIRKALFFFILLLIVAKADASEEYTEHTSTVCKGNICSTTIYPQPKFIDSNQGWLEISENFQQLKCLQGYKYCTDKDRALFQLNLDESFKLNILTSPDKDFTVQLDTISYNGNEINLLTDVHNFTVSENIISYGYKYFSYEIINLPTGIEDLITFYNPESIKEDVVLTYRVSKNYDFEGDDLKQSVMIGNVFWFDEYLTVKGEQPLGLFTAGQSQDFLKVAITKGNFTSSDIEFPTKYIDPTFTFSTKPSVDVYVERKQTFPSPYRFFDLRFLITGVRKLCDPLFLPLKYRSSMDFNLSSIPDGARVINATLNLTLQVVEEATNNVEVNLSHMEHSFLHYFLNGADNQSAYFDMGNGTLYDVILANASSVNKVIGYPLGSSARSDIQDVLIDNSEYWSVGMRSTENDNCTYSRVFYYSSSAVNSSTRPVLIVDYEVPTISNIVIYALNGSESVIGNYSDGTFGGIFNTPNMSIIEFAQLNFTIQDDDGIANITLFYTSNGTNSCSFGNLQSNSCFTYPNFVEVINNTVTSTFDATQEGSERGDFIVCNYIGNSTVRDYTCTIDEHYNPNVFKWYSAAFNWSDIKFQDGVNQRIRKNRMIKVEINESIVPLNSDIYKLDFRVNVTGNPTPLQAFMCNSTYSVGDPEVLPECVELAERNSSQLGDDGNKWRALFNNAFIKDLGNAKYIILRSESPGLMNYYSLKTVFAKNASWTTHWEFTTNNGNSWSNLGDGYEAELNINWFNNNLINFTQTIFKIEVLDDLGNRFNLSEFNFSWNVTPTFNVPPLVNIKSPEINETVSLETLMNITWETLDANADSFTTNVTITNTTNTTIVGENLDDTITFLLVNLSNLGLVSGDYNVTVESCENETADNFCGIDRHNFIIGDVPDTAWQIAVIYSVAFAIFFLCTSLNIGKFRRDNKEC